MSTRYRLCANSAATGILRNYRKAKRKNPRTKDPYARRLWLTTCYDFKVGEAEITLPFRGKERVSIPFAPHMQQSIVGFTVRSVTLTEDRLCLSYAKEVEEVQPHGFIGLDRNLDSVTVAASDDTMARHDLSQATQVKATYREVCSHMTRNDYRVRRQVSGKYGRKQREKVQQILNRASRMIVAQAKQKQFGIVMEKLTGIRKLYRKGNGQGRRYRGLMNSWSFAELQRQIEYKAKWLGLPVIYVSPHGTSSKCSICGQKMVPEENRMLRCASCGYTVDRDVNAAKNILAKGMKMGGVRFAPFASASEAMKLSCLNEQVDADELAEAGLGPLELTEPCDFAASIAASS